MAVQTHDAKSAAQDPLPPSEQLREDLIAALRTIYDPEIPVNIYDLGLIYSLDIDAQGSVEIEMTLTAPACPVAGTFPATVETRLREVSGISDVHVQLVWEPAWTRERLSEAARLELGMM